MRKNLLYLVFLLMLACRQEENYYPPMESMETTDRKFIEESTDLFIPQNAKNLQAYLEGARETSFYIKFLATPQDVEKVIQSSTCETPLKNSDTPWMQPSDYLKHLEWWTPEKAKTYLWCYGEIDTTHHSIFIDTTDTQEYIFYLLDSWY